MPIPILPLAGVALSTGAAVWAGYNAYSNLGTGRRDQRAEDALDTLDEGVTLRTEAQQANATGRWRRVVQLGKSGPAVEIDASFLGRLKIKRVQP